MATTQGAPPSNVSPNSMYAVKAMKADAIRNRSARRILHFRGGVSDRGRPKLDFSKFHIIRFALISQNTANATRIMKRMAGYISRILTQAIATSLPTHPVPLAGQPPYATPRRTIPHGQQHQCGRLSPTPTSTNARRPQQPLDHWSRFNANATPLALLWQF